MKVQDVATPGKFAHWTIHKAYLGLYGGPRRGGDSLRARYPCGVLGGGGQCLVSKEVMRREGAWRASLREAEAEWCTSEAQCCTSEAQTKVESYLSSRKRGTVPGCVLVLIFRCRPRTQPFPLEAPGLSVPRHRATVGSYGGAQDRLLMIEFIKTNSSLLRP